MSVNLIHYQVHGVAGNHELFVGAHKRSLNRRVGGGDNRVLAACGIGFVIDLYITNTGLVRFNKVLKEYQKAIDRRYLHALEFIRRSRRTFEMRIEGRRKHFENVLSFQQRRTIESFPHFISTRYEDALERLRELNANTRKDNKTQAKTKKKK